MTDTQIIVLAVVIVMALVLAVPYLIKLPGRESEALGKDIVVGEAASIDVPKETKIVYIYEPVTPDEFILLPEDLACLDGPERDICFIAQTIFGEARGMSKYEMSLVAWCIINRADSPNFPNTIEGVVSQSGQFHGYSEDNPIEKTCYEIAKDVYIRWNMENQVVGSVGRTLPKDYLFFYGKDGHNKFRIANTGAGYWDFTDVYPNPYE